MIIKHADDKQHDLDTLDQLLSLPHIGEPTKAQIAREIKNIQSGIKGESEAAYHINFHYGDSKNWMIIHDLRIEHQGHAAQIDHLICNRFMEVYVCESKRFGEGIAINEHGEFSAFYQGKPYGIPSPIEQNNRHISLLKRIFKNNEVELPMRLGLKIQPNLLSLILVANSARINRPQNTKQIQELDRIIKNEQVQKKIDRDLKEESTLSSFTSIAKIISPETLQAFAESLAALHQPNPINWKARFGITDTPTITPLSSLKEEPTPYTTSTPKPAIESQTATSPTDQPSSANIKAPRLFCAGCGVTVTPTVAKFCWSHRKRFNGKVYCFKCQKNH